MAHREADGNSCGLEVAATSPLSPLMRAEEGGKDAGETDLRFWELHRPGPYLVVQSQYVLINKWALHRQAEEKQKQGKLTRWGF